MERFIVEFGLRSILIAGAAALVLLVLKIRSAAPQHRIWTGVLVVMLALPVWLQWGPKAALPILPAPEPAIFGNVLVAQTDPSAVQVQVETPAPKLSVWSWETVLIGVYLLGAGALLLRLIVGTIRASRLTDDSCTTPVTVGVLRPRVILPNQWREWPQAQLDAILTHEQAHARRRDPLVQWLALLNRALFWFHPLTWWLERRLSALAEEACDAAVLAHGHDARSYSEYLLEMARAVQRAGVRVHLTGMAMPGSSLPQRIRKMISGASVIRVSPARMACAAVLCLICSILFGAGTPKPARTLLAQAAPAGVPKFEVASIKACKDGAVIGRGGKGGGRVLTPGRLSLNCMSVDSLIQSAYVTYANGKNFVLKIPRPPIEGGAGWIHSDGYQIEAKAAEAASQEMMRGPMLRALLEDRFKLSAHWGTREVPVYALTVAKGGPKLQAAKEGRCTVFDFDHPPTPGFSGEMCGAFHGDKTGVDTYSQTMAGLCMQFSGGLGREVVDKTGLTGKFDIHLELSISDLFGRPPGGRIFADGTPELSDAELAIPPDPFGAISAAVRNLGLELKSAKGPGQFLVIDHVERPTEN